MARVLVLLLFACLLHSADGYIRRKLVPVEYAYLKENCGKGEIDDAIVKIKNGLTNEECTGVLITRYHFVTVATCLASNSSKLIAHDGFYFDNITMHVTLADSLNVRYKRKAYARTIVALAGYPDLPEGHEFALVELVGFRESDQIRWNWIPCLPTPSRALKIVTRVSHKGFNSALTDITHVTYEQKTEKRFAMRYEFKTVKPNVSDILYRKVDGRLVVYGLVSPIKHMAIDLASWTEFICAHTRLCLKGFDYVPEPEDYIDEGNTTNYGFSALAQDYYQFRAKDEDCSYDHLLQFMERSTTFDRLSEEQNIYVNRHCGKAMEGSPTRERRAIGGTELHWDDHPYTVSVVFTHYDGGICTGTLISPFHVLTSRTCLTNWVHPLFVRPWFMKVLIGSRCSYPLEKYDNFAEYYEKCDNTTRTNVVSINVTRLVVPFCEDDHQKAKCELVNDVAILLLRYHVPFNLSVPICLPKRNDKLPFTGTLVGFGESREPCNNATADCARKNNSMANVLDNVKWRKGECLAKACKQQLLKKNGNPIISDKQDGGSPYSYVKNNRRYLMGVLSKSYNKTSRSTLAVNIKNVLNFICMATGVCPDGLPMDSNLPLLVPAVKGRLADHNYVIELYWYHPRKSYGGEYEGLGSVVQWLERVRREKPERPVPVYRYNATGNQEIQRKCGKNWRSVNARIHFGNGINSHELLPYVIGVYINKIRRMIPICMGAMISPRHVLTARTCTSGAKSPKDVRIVDKSACFSHFELMENGTIGERINDLNNCKKTSPPGEFVEVVNIFTIDREQDMRISGYRAMEHKDIAVLELKRDLDRASYLCLPASGNKYVENPVIVGAGANLKYRGEDSTFGSGHLAFMNVSSAEWKETITDGHLIYEYKGPRKTNIVMPGMFDEGAPVIRIRPNRKRTIFAVVSEIVHTYDYAEEIDRRPEDKKITAVLASWMVPVICDVIGICPDEASRKSNNISEVMVNDDYNYCLWKKYPDDIGPYE